MLAAHATMIPTEPHTAPLIGAMLRHCLRQVRARTDAAARAAGFTDLEESHLAFFYVPLPDNVRPADLARRIGVSRQALNLSLQQLERMGYVERRTTPDSGRRRLIYMTPRGWQVRAAIVACVEQLQAEWSEEIGAARFADFLAVLRQLSGLAHAADATNPD